MIIKTVGVVGCGTMGSGIVQVIAQSGYQVVVSETQQQFLDKGLASIKSVLTKGVEKGKILPQDKDSALSRIKGTIEMNDFNNCDLVIEAAVENLGIKKKIFSELDKICPAKAMLATNTSCLSITDVAMATNRPGQVLGMHFFNPPHIMPLLEMGVTMLTSQETIESCQTFVKSLGKTVVLVKDTPGFIANRLALPYILNAIRLLQDGVATRDDIDNSMKLGYNHPSGPLYVADLIGLDVVLFIVDAMYQELKDPQFVSPVLLKKMVTAGLLGRKTGKGFYDYK
jgi:3-hydroxybutyryl-CoA dehydrogenase